MMSLVGPWPGGITRGRSGFSVAAALRYPRPMDPHPAQRRATVVWTLMAFLLLQGIGAIGVLIALLTLLSPVRRYCGVRVLGGA